MIRLLLLLLGTLTTVRRDPWDGTAYRAAARDGSTVTAEPDAPGPPGPAGPAAPDPWPARPGPPYRGGAGERWTRPVPPRRRRLRPWVKWAAGLAVAGVIFRRAIASVVLLALSATLHFLGFNIQLPHIRFAWPWQTISAGHTTNTDLGPWVLQKLEGISRPALGQANFNFYFTHKVSKSIGPWPCWYASTFYAVGHASATVDLNPGPAWWAPATGHYQLQVLSRPRGGKPGHVTVMMALPTPQLPQSAHGVTIDNLPSRPIDTQHSWTYPGLGCGVLLKPQFAQSVLYAQAQTIAYYKATHSPQITGALVKTAEAEAVQTIRNNFIQPTVNAFGYVLDGLTIRWTGSG